MQRRVWIYHLIQVLQKEKNCFDPTLTRPHSVLGDLSQYAISIISPTARLVVFVCDRRLFHSHLHPHIGISIPISPIAAPPLRLPHSTIDNQSSHSPART